MKDSGKNSFSFFFFFFKFTHFFAGREFPHTKCPGGIWKHRSNRNFTTICKSSGSIRLSTFPGLGPTPANQTWPGVGPRSGPQPRPGLAHGCESEAARPVGERGCAATRSVSGCKIQREKVLTGKKQLFQEKRRKKRGRRNLYQLGARGRAEAATLWSDLSLQLSVAFAQRIL